MPYYIKKRIIDIIISTIMLVMLAITLLPIGWMVYSSLKDSTDIAIGKIGLRRASTAILKIIPQKDELLVFSANGGIGIFQSKDLKKTKYLTFKTAASSYLVEKDYIWLASANRGLLRISRENWENQKSFAFPNEEKIEWNRVPATYIRRAGDFIYVALDYKNYGGVFKFDPNERIFERTIKGGKAKYFPDAGKIVSRQYAGAEGEIFAETRVRNYLCLGTSSGKIYKYDPEAQKVIAQANLPAGHLLIRFQNYIDMWKNVNFGLYLRNSLIICGFTMVFAMIFSTLAAYALSRFRFPGSDLFSNGILATQMIPAIMYLIPLYIMFVKFTILTGIPVKGTFYGIIMIYSAFFIPFSIWILRGFFASIPKELEEAAMIDGCSRFKVFWYIALPLAIPGIVATGIYIFLTAWDELMFAWVLTNADTMTIPVGIRLFVGNYQNRFDLMMAASTVATLPVVVLFFLLQRHIVKGLTAGAVKG